VALIIASVKPISPSYFTIVCAHPGSAILSFITVMFHLGYLISLTHLCFIAFLSLYVVLIDAQLQECLINLLTYFWCIQSQGKCLVAANVVLVPDFQKILGKILSLA